MHIRILELIVLCCLLINMSGEIFNLIIQSATLFEIITKFPNYYQITVRIKYKKKKKNFD